jgi:tetratricopeptide (TPR) repeat protein
MNAPTAISNSSKCISPVFAEEQVKERIEKARNLAKSPKTVEQVISIFEELIGVFPDNASILIEYAKAMRATKQYPKAESLFLKALEQEPNNVSIITVYAQMLLNSPSSFLDKSQKYGRVSELFDRALAIEPNNLDILIKYGCVVANMQHFPEANQLFNCALRVDEKNISTLNIYANILSQQGYYERASELYEDSIQLDGNNGCTIAKYANVLMQQGYYWRARDAFELALKVDKKNREENYQTLAEYAITLVFLGEYSRAEKLFERALQLGGMNPNAKNLARYANALARKEQYERACEFFELSLKHNGRNSRTLAGYANLLVRLEKYERAYEFFELSIKLKGCDSITFYNFASALVHTGKFERAISITPKDTYVRWKYAQQLESQNKYDDALTQLLAVNLTEQANRHANIVRLNLGRLYYRLNKMELGRKYIEEAIANSDGDDKDESVLYAARSLFAVNPHSEEAVGLLRQIDESSSRHNEAMKTLALKADAQTYYNHFADGKDNFDTAEMLYRSMYHKIGNEVAILKSIAYRLLRKIEGEHPIVSEIVRDLDKLQQSIVRQRSAEKAAISEIPLNNYKQLIEIVSKTAHNISDEVNNSLATIESKTRRALHKLSDDSPLHENFEKLLTQLELTQTALNDLKSINEGMTIRRDRFLVKKLFEKWEPANWGNKPRIQKARIKLNLENSNTEFDGDEEKIKSIINELVENSLKHNTEHRDLSIWISAQDVLNPTDIGMPTIPGDRKFLRIQISDNGKGIPKDKKEWIFQPLNTTSPEEKGSGLGLFIARKTLQKMGGGIHEVGEFARGAKFQIYIPYPSSNEL